MSANLQNLLHQLKDLQSKIEEELHKSESVYELPRHKIFPSVESSERFRKDLPSPDNPYYLLTITFDPLISNKLDEVGQRMKLTSCLDKLNKYIYYSCLEKHKSGVLHAHALIICDHHKIQPILYHIRSIVSTSVRLMPSVNIKPVNQSYDDVNRSFNYIIQHKEDHPEYKFLQFNI